MESCRRQTALLNAVRRLSLVVLLSVFALGSAGCAPSAAPTNGNAQTPVTNTAAAPTESGQSTFGRVAMRLQMKYAENRTATGGVAFAIATGDGTIVLTSAHIVATMSRGKTLTSVSILDGGTREPVCEVLGVVFAGTAFEGYDYSKDVTALAVRGLPESVRRLELATERPKVGDRVTVLAIPADGSSGQVAIEGVVRVATSLRHEIDVPAGTNGRGFAGAPIVSNENGRVVGVTQAVTAKSGQPFIIATPAEAFAGRIPAGRVTPLPITAWTGR